MEELLINYLVKNPNVIGMDRIIDLFGIKTRLVFVDGSYDLLGVKDSKVYRIEVESTLCSVKDNFLYHRLLKEEVEKIDYINRVITLKNGTKIDIKDKFVWVGKKYVNIYYKVKEVCDMIVYSNDSDPYSKGWKKKLEEIGMKLFKVEGKLKRRIDRDSIGKFLTFMTFLDYKCNRFFSGYWEIRIINNHGKLVYRNFCRDLLEIVVSLNTPLIETHNTYMGIFPRIKPKGTSEMVKRCHLIFIDLDSPKAIEDIEYIYDKLTRLNLQPSLIGISGGGVHVYYKFDPIDVEEWKKVQVKALKFFDKEFKEYKVDMKIKDPPRISRVLGTFNGRKGKISRIWKVIYQPKSLKSILRVIGQ